MKTYHFVVPAALDGARLDLALVAAEFGLSRRKIRSAIDAGGVYVNKKRVRIASRQVHAGDEIRLEYNEAALKLQRGQAIAFDDKTILYDAHDLIVIDKPPGLPSQATRDQAVLHVETCLKGYYESRGQKPPRVILVHRLDKDTSGVLILARTPERATELTDLFRERRVKKTYWAISSGLPSSASFVERAPLSPIDKKTGMVRVVRSGGKSAVTSFKVLGIDPGRRLTWLECRPETGRSHQIRVHLAHRGLPIVGDKRYGGGALSEEIAALVPHHLLHARSIAFELSGVGPLELTAEPPKAFRAVLERADWRAAQEKREG